MTHSRISAATRRPARFGVEQLEDRAVPATFTSAGFTFEQLSTPDNQSLLPQATYDAALVNVTPTTATGTVTGFPDDATGFDPTLALGTLVDATNPPKALVLGGAGTTDRSGVLLSWTGGKGIVNATGDDLVVYETEPGTTATAKPEAFMIEVHDATTNTWSNWYYEPADSVAAVTGIGGNPGVVFATAFDLSNLGLAANDVIDQVRIVNMTSADRMANASGVGQVLPGDNGTTSTNLPSAGTFGTLGGFTPEILYAGTPNALTNPLVNVSVTKTDNATAVAPGGAVQYTIVVSNSGPNAATGTTFTDTLPTNLTNVSWTSSTSTGVTGSAGTGQGNISETLSLPANSSITYTVNATLSNSATGTLSNTATATVSNTLTDSNTANNSATDTTAISAAGGTVDLSVTKTDNVTSVTAGQQVTYTIVASNLGTSPVTGATLTDTFPATLTSVTWTSTQTGGAGGNSATGSGDINQTLNLPAGASVTYTITATVAAGTANGTTIQNTATIATPNGVTDTSTTNNTATDTDTVVAAGFVDLSVTKTDNTTSVTAGQQVTYAIVASNLGPTAVTGAVLTDTLPATLTNVTWTSTQSGGATGNTATGSGNINQTLNLPAGSSVTYTVTATVAAGTTGGTSIQNTATIATPNGVTDNVATNNTATDTDTVAGSSGGGTADLSITKTDNLKFVTHGLPTTYTITVTNVGSTAVTGAQVLDNVSSELTGVSWTASVSGGATVAATSGNGSINQLVNLPVGASVTYTLTGTVTTAARGGLINSATVNVPVGVTDTNPSNNFAQDRDTVLPKPVPPFLRQFAMGVGNTGLVALFNNDGTLRTVLNPSLGLGGVAKAVMGDLNGDGMEDVVITMLTGPLKGLVEVLDGVTLTPLQVFFPIPIPGLPVDVAVGDVNGDGFQDLVFSTTSGLPVIFAKDFVTGELLTLFSPINIPLPAFSISTINVDNSGPDEIALNVPVGTQTIQAIFNTASQLVGIRVI